MAADLTAEMETFWKVQNRQKQRSNEKAKKAVIRIKWHSTSSETQNSNKYNVLHFRILVPKLGKMRVLIIFLSLSHKANILDIQVKQYWTVVIYAQKLGMKSCIPVNFGQISVAIRHLTSIKLISHVFANLFIYLLLSCPKII